MSLVAFKDKGKRIRVSTSEDLHKVDYYCSNMNCNAIMRGIDCNDEICK